MASSTTNGAGSISQMAYQISEMARKIEDWATEQGVVSEDGGVKIKFDFQDTIGVIVGEDERDLFQIPKALICPRSAFFAAAFPLDHATRNWEAVELLDHTSDVFSIYLQLIYTGRLVVFHHDLAKDWPPRRSWEAELVKILDVYYLANKLGDPKATQKLMAAVGDWLDVHGKERPVADAAATSIWHWTEGGSPLRQLFGRYVVENWSPREIADCGYRLMGFQSDIDRIRRHMGEWY